MRDAERESFYSDLGHYRFEPSNRRIGQNTRIGLSKIRGPVLSSKSSRQSLMRKDLRVIELQLTTRLGGLLVVGVDVLPRRATLLRLNCRIGALTVGAVGGVGKHVG